jgi:hypothetical protein
MKQKTTSGGTETNTGLNEGNPNTHRTPAGNERCEPDHIRTGLVGGTAQSNYEDEKKGDVPHDTRQNRQGDDTNRGAGI